MNKKKVVGSIFVCMLMCVTVSTVTGTQIVDESGGQQVFSEKNLQNRAMWDVQFQYDVGGDTGSLYLVGVAYDGTYFYCPEFNSPTIYRFDHDGNLVDSITISGVPNLVDLTFDGTYVYGPSTTGNILYQMDMNSQTLVSSIPIPVSYNVAYDADADGGNGGFWVGQWQVHLTLVDMSGNTIDSITPVPESMLGMAWDNVCEIQGYNGPYLWIFTGTSTGGQGVIKVIDLDTKSIITGVEHNVALDLGMGIAGGLGFTTDWADGFATLYGLVQGADPPEDYIFGYEMCQTNGPPEIPTIDGPTMGFAGVEIEYTLETTEPDGEDVYYYVEWGDGDNTGWIGPYASGEEVTVGHTWTSADDYEIRAKAKDINDAESDWSDVIVLTIVVTDPPSAPDISGTEEGKPGESYSYYFTSTDPDGDDVSYFIDWGDGETTDWTPYRTSGAMLKEDHEFSEYGTFIIKAKAKDIYNAESDWAELSVAMPRNRAVNTPFLNFLESHPILYQLLLRFLRL